MDDPQLLQNAEMTEIAKDLKMFKISECFNSAVHKVETLSIPGTATAATASALIALLVSHCGGTLKTSVAPKGRLERQLQAFIESTKE